MRISTERKLATLKSPGAFVGPCESVIWSSMLGELKCFYTWAVEKIGQWSIMATLSVFETFTFVIAILVFEAGLDERTVDLTETEVSVHSLSDDL